MTTPPQAPASLVTLAARLNALCDAQPFYTGWYLKDLRAGEVAHRHGDQIVPSASTGAHCYNDAGIVYRGDEPRFILTVYTNKVPAELPDGASAPGVTSLLIATLARTCWDILT